MGLLRKSMSGLATALILGALAGCGGSGSVPSNTQTPEIAITGGVTTMEAVATTNIPADEDSHSVGDAEIPPGVAVAAGESVAIIPDGTEFISGLTGGVRAPSAGSITVNGHLVRAKVARGKITPALGFPAGRYHLEATGPFSVRANGGVLTIQTISLDFDSNGHTLSLPKTINGSIPTNGSNSWTKSLTVTFPADYSSGSATLDITHVNGELKQTQPVTDSGATFRDFSDDPQSHIPAGGIDTLNFTHFGNTVQ